MSLFQQLASRQILGLTVLSSRRSGTSVDILDILSEKNKRRCKAQLEAMGKSLDRKKSEKEFKKHAAVLIPLCFVDCQPSIIFTLRSSKLRRHAGQVSFPGGMVNNDDSDTVETALRESEEELGFRTSNIDVWGSMLPLPDRSGEVQITPILANIGKVNVDEFNPNYDEVECIFTRDIMSLCSAKNFAQTTFSTPPKGGYTLPVYLGGEHKIWGLTAVMLHQTLSLLAPGMYKNKLSHPKTLKITHETATYLSVIKELSSQHKPPENKTK